MLQRYVGGRPNKRKRGSKFAQTFVIFLGEDQTQPDTKLLKFMGTHTHSSVAASPSGYSLIPAARVKLSVKRRALLGRTGCLSVFL